MTKADLDLNIAAITDLYWPADPKGSEPNIPALANAIADVVIEACVKAIREKASQDTDWGNSYWNQAVEMCAFAVEKLKIAPSSTAKAEAAKAE